MNDIRSVLLAAAALITASAGAALAFHPLMTEDTGFLGGGTRQLETGLEYSDPGGGGYSRSLAGVFSYGVRGGLDIIVGVPWQELSGGGSAAAGPSDLSLEAKLRVTERAGWTFVLKPGFSLATGDEEKGLGAGKSGFWAYGVAGRTAGPWQFYLNAGYFHNGNNGGEKEAILKGSAAAVRELGGGFLLSADLGVETSAEQGSASHPLHTVLGLVWSPSSFLDLDAGVKLGLNGGADRAGFLAGATLRF